MSLAGALGPFGEIIVVAVAGLVAFLSRRQVMKSRTDLAKSQSEAAAFKEVALSLRPISELAQLSIPPLPVVRTGFSPSSPRPSLPRDDESEP